MKSYDTYKKSDVQWLGQIPSHWSVSRLKFLSYKLRSGGTPKADNSSFYTDESGTPWVAIADMSSVDFIKETEKHLTKAGLEDKNLQIYPAGTLLYSIYATLGKVAELSIPAAINQAILAISLRPNYLQSYCKYALKAQESYVIGLASTNTQANLNAEKVANYVMPVPPIDEQKAIADFLDAKTYELDIQKESLLKQIEILKELRLSIITNAITRGISNSTELKDSGVTWIGEVPNNWEVVRLKNYCYLKGRIGWKGLRSDEFKDKAYAYLVTGEDFKSSEVDWSQCYQIERERYEEDPYIQLKNGDILVTKDGTIGKVAKVTNLDKPACLNSGIFVLKQKKNKNKFTQGYIYWTLQSKIFKDFIKVTTTGTTILHLYQYVFDNMPLLVPPIEEQDAIASFLDKKTSEIDEQIELQELQIKLIDELKQSIISQAVTGKIKVI